jgi:hemerythrin
VKWCERFATGIAQLDEQHKMLFQMSDDYRETLDEGRGERSYGLILQTLDEYARAHFGIEDQCMHRHHCPAAGANSRAHGEFVRAVAQFKAHHSAVGFTDADARQLVEYVDGWLAEHIGGIDVQLKPCVEPLNRV